MAKRARDSWRSEPITKAQIGLIKARQKELGMSDTDYRQMLSGYGVMSCTQLTKGGASDLIERLTRDRAGQPKRRCGSESSTKEAPAKGREKSRAGARRSQGKVKRGGATEAQFRLIWAAKKALGLGSREWEDLLGRYGVSVERDLEVTLTNGDAKMLIDELREMGFSPAKPDGWMHWKPPAEKRTVVDSIKRKLRAIGETTAYVDRIAQQMFGDGSGRPVKVQWLNEEQLQALNIALIREQKKRQEAGNEKARRGGRGRKRRK